MSGLEVLHSGMVSKRAVGKKGVFGALNWKKRFLVLDYGYLSYYDKYWDTKGGDSQGVEMKGQIQVCNIRGVEHVDYDAFKKNEVLQVLFVDVDATGPLGEEVLRTLYVEADGGVKNGVSPSQEWIDKIRGAYGMAGDRTMFLDKYCSGTIGNDGKYTCCGKGKDEVNLLQNQGCKVATVLPAQSTMQEIGKTSAAPRLPSSPPPEPGSRISASASMKVAPTQAKPRPPAPSPSMRQVSRNPSDDVPSLPARGGSGGIARGVSQRGSIKPGAPPVGLALATLAAEPWFKESMTSVETSKILMTKEEGEFFVRKSQAKPGAYTVDIRTSSTKEPIVAKRIYRTEDGFFRFEGDSVTYISMRECLKNCSDFRINLPPPPRPKTKAPRSSQGSIRAGGSMKNIPWQTKEKSRATPAAVSRQPSVRPGGGPVVNTRTLATDDDIYGEITFGDYEDVNLDANDDDANTGAETLRVREMVAMTNTPDHPPEQSGGDGPLRAKNKLWKQRPDVTPGLLASMDKKAITRQEAIFELVYSEEAYLRDVQGLIDVYLEGIDAKGLIDAPSMKKFLESARTVQSAGKALVKDLQARQSMSTVVELISDVLEKHVESVATALYNYCEIALELRERSTDAPPELASFLVSTMNSSESRGLPIDAYVLCPVQRMVRYPMLIGEIEKATIADPSEKYNLGSAQKRWTQSVHKCNQRFAEIENWHNLKDLQSQLNYDKVEGAEMIWRTNHRFGYRSMAKNGALELVKLNDSKKKISKRKNVEVMLFSDMFLFAKSVKSKKTGRVEFIVFKQAHRSLMTVDRLRSPGAAVDSRLEFIIEVVFHSKDKRAYASGEADAGTDTIYFKAKDHMEMDRWLEAFNPPKEEEDIYQAWECPQFVVLKDWTPPRKEENDSMPLRKGEIIEVEKRGDNYMKGRLKHPEPFVSYNVAGYFPASHVREIESHRKTARAVKELAKQNAVNCGKASF